MNGLDIVIVIVLVLGALMGMRMGLIQAVFNAVGVWVGWLLAGQFADDLGQMLSNSLTGDTVITVVAYAIIIVLALIVTSIGARIVRPILTILTVGLAGLVDKLGGLAMGVLIGGLLSSALIMGLARFTYNFEIPEVDEGFAGEVVERLPDPEDVKETLEEQLTGSTFVPIFIDVSNAVPGDTFGVVPADFRVALDILEQQIDEGE